MGDAKGANLPLYDVLKRGVAPHYAIVLDRSDAGREMMQAIRTDTQLGLVERLDEESLKMWTKLTAFEFLVISGSWGLGGGATLPTRDIDSLLSAGLGDALKRAAAKGGKCTFFLGVDPKYRQRIEYRLAELQPARGPSTS